MFFYIWPMALVVLSNVVYQICAKSIPNTGNPFASLTVTYLVSVVVCAILYFVTTPGGNLIKEYSKLNWAPCVFGIVLVGLEAGWIYAYKAGWQVSTAYIVQGSVLAVALLSLTAETPDLDMSSEIVSLMENIMDLLSPLISLTPQGKDVSSFRATAHGLTRLKGH